MITLPWFKIFLPQTLTLLLCGSLVLQTRRQSVGFSTLKSFEPNQLKIILLLFVLVAVTSVVQTMQIPEHADLYPLLNWSGRNTPYFKSITQLLWMFVGIGAFIASLAVLKNEKQVGLAVKTLIYGQAITAALSVVQIAGYALDLRFINTAFRGITVLSDLDSGRVIRAHSVFTEPSHLAVFHAMALPLVLGLRYKGKSLIVPLILFSFLMTFSRSMMLMTGSLTALFLLSGLRTKGKQRIRSLFILIFCLLGFELVSRAIFHTSLVEIFSGQFSSFGDTNNFSNYQRLISMQAAFDIFLKHPILGVGIGNYAFHIASVANPEDLPNIMPIAGNFFLELLCETGILGLGALLLFLVKVRNYVTEARQWTQKTFFRNDAQVLTLLLMGFYVMLIGFFTFSAFFFPFVWVYLAIMLAAARSVQATGYSDSVSRLKEKQNSYPHKDFRRPQL
ncbi:MAG: O-antigen ligase family protein [Bacteriovoracia bacterium]